MADIFISYSHKDYAFAKKIDEFLTSIGFDVWRDDRLVAGIKFEGEIKTQLSQARVFLCIISQAFLDSEYCQNEVGYAEAHDLTFLPCKIEKCQPGGFLSTRNQIDFTKPYDTDEIGSDYPYFQLDVQVRNLIAESELNDLRDEIIDFYEGQLAIANEVKEKADYKTSILEKIPGSGEIVNDKGKRVGWMGREERFREKILHLSQKDFVKVGKLILEYLKNKNSVRNTFPISAQWCINFFPAWRIDMHPISNMGKDTILSIIPSALLDRHRMYEQGDIIEALVHFPNQERFTPDEHFLHVVFPDLTYWTANEHAPVGLGWTNMIGKSATYFFIPSKGIYRVATVSQSPNGAIVSFLKYLGIEATRAKLGNALQHNEAVHVKSSVLQLMYAGFHSGMFGGGEVQFFLYNNRDSIAVVQNIQVVVHKVTKIKPEPHPGEGATLMEYRYQIQLSPNDKRIIVSKDTFKYSPGEIDKFTIKFSSSKPGYEYEISVVIDWFDIQTGKTASIETPKELIECPKYY